MRPGVRFVTLKMIASGASFSPAQWEVNSHIGSHSMAHPERLAVYKPNIMPKGSSGSRLFVVAFDQTSQCDGISLIAVASYANNSVFGVWRPVDQVVPAHEVPQSPPRCQSMSAQPIEVPGAPHRLPLRAKRKLSDSIEINTCSLRRGQSGLQPPRFR